VRPISASRLAGAIIFVFASAVASAQPIRQHLSTTTTQPSPAASTSSTVSMARVAAALIGVISLIFLLKWAGRGLLGQTPSARASGAVSVLTRSNIAPRQQIMLIQVGRRLVLVGNSGGAMNALCEIKEAEEVSELLGKVAADKTGSMARTFGTLFRKEEDKFAEPAVEESEGAEAEEQDVGLARQEIRGLMDKVRGLSTQFRRT
jgi:flagellar biogenesis protein FliO